MPTPADEPVVLHIWVAAGHSLCELETGDYTEEPRQELKSAGAAVCGPCLLIVGRLRRHACALLEFADGAIAPDRPSDAWRLLGKSGWGSRLDIKTFLRANPDVDTQTRYEAVRYAIDPESVTDLVSELKEMTEVEPSRARRAGHDQNGKCAGRVGPVDE